MIDRKSRDIAADLVESFRLGRITNDELEDAWPKSEDPAIDEIGRHLWSTYDDMAEMRFCLTTETADVGRLYGRAVSFLRSSLEYEWPRSKSDPISPFLIAVVFRAFSKVFWKQQTHRFREAGDLEAWPFVSLADWTRIGEAQQ